MSTSYDAIVIGAGVNGLVAAAVLSKAGRRVLVVERAEQTGGQTRAIEFAPGYRAPLGPDAGWLSPAVARGIGLAVPLSTAPAISVSVADDSGFMALPSDPTRAADVIRKYSTRDATRWAPFTARLNKLAGFLGELSQLPAPDIDTTAFGDVLSMFGLGRKFRALGRADMTELLRVMPMSIQDLLDDEFESDSIKAAIGAGGVRDIRQGPRSGGTTFVLLHHLIGAASGSVRARPWWRDAPDALVDSVEAMARRHGTVIRTGTRVTRIDVKDDAVSGVVLAGGEEIFAPLVISTADPTQTLGGLVDPVWLDPDVLLAVRNIKYRGCTAFVLYALEAMPSASANGLGADELASVVSLTTNLSALERAYDAAKYGGISAEPHVEISVPTLRWPALAPSGKHVLSARVQYVPYELADGGWNADGVRALEDSVTRIISRALPGFDALVRHSVTLAPVELEARFGVTGGALTHGELTLDQILFMRPIAGYGRHAMPIDGLYLGGRGAHPGPGILGGAGWLAARAATSRGAKTAQRASR
jgi:phytoene dehydrogenase-like protein